VDRDTDVSSHRSDVDPEAVVEPTGVVNGASWSGHERNHYWRNLGGKAFQEQSGISGADVDGDGRTFCLFDYDRDGFQDFVLVSANRPFVQLFRNQQGDIPGVPPASFLVVELVGGKQDATPGGEWSNRNAIGATLELQAGGLKQTRELRSGEGLSGQNRLETHFGIGQAQAIDSLRILWPSGRETVLENLQANQLVQVYENPEHNDGAAHFAQDWLPQPPIARPSTSSSTKLAPMGKPEPLLVELAKAGGANGAEYQLYTTWFTTCQACKRAEPTFRALRRAFSEEKLAFFGFNNDAGDSDKEMAAYQKRFQPPYVMLSRSKQQIQAFKDLQDRYPPHDWSDQGTAVSEQTPSTILADSQGRVLRTWIGVPDVSTLRRALAGL